MEKLPPGYDRRFSFCCERDGCRQRTTPASVRFLGRRAYLGVVVVLLAVLAEGATPRRERRLREIAGGVSRRTLERWRKWWREAFPRTRFWREHRARFMPVVAPSDLPSSLLERMACADEASRLVALLSFLSPLTTTTSAFRRAS